LIYKLNKVLTLRENIALVALTNPFNSSRLIQLKKNLVHSAN